MLSVVKVDELSPATVDPYIRLATTVIARAIREAEEGDRSAEKWLRSSVDADLYFDLAGLSRDVVVDWLDAGARIPEETRGRKAVPLSHRIGLQLAFEW